MMRKYFFSEEYGRNIIWPMLSGFFLKIGAKENIFGQIIMPKDHYLFNLDEKKINNEYLSYNNLHYILLDGATEYIADKRLRNIKSKINIYYVGKLDAFWNNIENAQPLFPDSLDEFYEFLPKIKKKFPIFFKKYFLKKFITTLINLKNFELFNHHIFQRKKFVYYGYIRPTQEQLTVYQNRLNLEYDHFKIFFEKCNDVSQLKQNVNKFCVLKKHLLQVINVKDYPYLNEFLLFMIRNILCNFLKEKDDFFIYDGAGGDYNFNAYEMLLGNQHVYLDFGSKVGVDTVYPRQALLNLSNRETIRFNLNEKFISMSERDSCLFLQDRIDKFLNNLNIKT
tara:strand:- start:1765 stop:2778 length:1014 start_codon:yes stop_codon:yes gene_type:complete